LQCPYKKAKEDGVASIASENQEAHRQEQEDAVVKGDHVGIEKGHARVVEGGDGIEYSYPPRRNELRVFSV
jgi:hypothetical protein